MSMSKLRRESVQAERTKVGRSGMGKHLANLRSPVSWSIVGNKVSRAQEAWERFGILLQVKQELSLAGV